MANTKNQPRPFPEHTSPTDVIRTGLAQMEAYLDRCIEIVQTYQLSDVVPSIGAPIEKKVKALILDPAGGVPEEESVAWLAQAIIDTKELFDSLATDPKSSDQEIAKFLNAWFADADVSGLVGKNTVERLHALMWIFCAGLEGFTDGLLFAGEEHIGFAGNGAESKSAE